jgi:metal-responsive CopG/Arc/MetJ family transcriptional regulator
MGQNHKRITISIPIELDRLIDSLVSESKKTSKPFSKSGFVVNACRALIEDSLNKLDSLKVKGGN